jgi:hypothetical protein
MESTSVPVAGAEPSYSGTALFNASDNCSSVNHGKLSNVTGHVSASVTSYVTRTPVATVE